VGGLLREEISEIIIKRLKDPRVGFITVTGVEMTDDLKSARVYVSVLERQNTQETLKVLNSAAGFIKKEVARDISLRSTPHLVFFEDKSIAYGEKIDGILNTIKKDAKNPADPSNGGLAPASRGSAPASRGSAPASKGATPTSGDATPESKGE
jgi:ribosome-binding factor A